MTTPEFSGRVPAAAEADGISLIGYHDMGGRPAFKLAMQNVDDRWYLYTGHFWESRWSILDVTEPTNPLLINSIEGPRQTWTLQVQVADGLMITALEKAAPGWGFEPEQTESTGILIWDVATDPRQPRLLSYFDAGGRGTHRNHYAGGRYAYLAAEPEGYVGNMMLVVDLKDPTRPTELSRWWWPGQWAAGGEEPRYQKYLHGPPYVDGDLAYLPYGQAGLVVLDISDRASPNQVGHLDFGDFGASIGCHTAVTYGDGVVVANSEAIAEGGEEQLNFAVTVSVADPSNPRILGWLPTPGPSSGTGLRNYLNKGGRFGPHNQHHFQGQSCLLEDPSQVYLTYFNAGLRIYDISDPHFPREVAFYVPEDPEERLGVMPESALTTQFEDVLVDSRGYIYCTDKNHGLFILKQQT